MEHNITCTPQWVRGHQDATKKEKDLMDLECLNISMDTMAEAAYILPPELRTNTDQEVLPAKIIAVYLHNAKITSSLKKSISCPCHGNLLCTHTN